MLAGGALGATAAAAGLACVVDEGKAPAFALGAYGLPIGEKCPDVVGGSFFWPSGWRSVSRWHRSHLDVKGEGVKGSGGGKEGRRERIGVHEAR